MPELSKAVEDRLLAFDPVETPPFALISTRAKRRRQVRVALFSAAVVAVVGAAGLALGQSSGATDKVLPYASPGATGAPPDGDVQPLSEVQLKKALLTEADLPEGYQLREPPPDARGTGCFARFASLEQPAEAEATARAHFEKGFGSRLTQTLASFSTPAQARGPLAAAQALVEQCPTFTGQNPDGSTTSFQIAAIQAQTAADDAVAFTVTGRAQSADVVVTVHVVRVGSTVMFVSQGTFVSDLQALEQAVERGVQRLRASE